MPDIPWQEISLIRHFLGNERLVLKMCIEDMKKCKPNCSLLPKLKEFESATKSIQDKLDEIIDNAKYE